MNFGKIDMMCRDKYGPDYKISSYHQGRQNLWALIKVNGVAVGYADLGPFQIGPRMGVEIPRDQIIKGQ